MQIKNKKSQLTIFIIISILIIAVVVLFFLFKDNLKIGKPASPETAEIQNFVEECLEDTARSGIYEIGQRGGYYKIPEQNKFSVYGQDYAYYYNGGFISPGAEIIEKELSEYVLVNLEDCFNFSSFNNRGFEVDYSDYSVYTSILDSEIEVEMRGLFTIKKNEEIFQINKFLTSFQSDFLNLIKSSEELVIDYSANPEFVCPSCISDISEKNKVFISSEVFLIPDFEEQVIFFSVDSSEEIFDDKILNLVFVVRK
ncbi:MAG: hypothetical protein Q8O84_00245 [Nanoarchaeota archaeon]|nr:hypothetical protein [Nanoarchaeota archaeon]